MAVVQREFSQPMKYFLTAAGIIIMSAVKLLFDLEFVCIPANRKVMRKRLKGWQMVSAPSWKPTWKPLKPIRHLAMNWHVFAAACGAGCG